MGEIYFTKSCGLASMRVCYIESPLQLTRSKDYNDLYHSEKITYIIRDNGNRVQRAQFENLMRNEKNWIFIKIPRGRIINKLVVLPYFSFLILKMSFRAKEFLVGDARSLFSRLIYFLAKVYGKEVVLVDDGTYLLNYWKKIADKNYSVFTSLPLENQIKDSPLSTNLNIIERPFDSINLIQGRAAIFIGMPLVELNFISLDAYMRAVRIACDRSCFDKKIYYAHRSEVDSKLNHVKRAGFEIIRPDLPLESFLKQSGAYQGDYYSFYSTALYNLSRMIKEVNFFSFRPRDSDWPNTYRAEILDCYELLDASKQISIVKLTNG